MRWNGTNDAWPRSQKHTRPFGVAHLVVGVIMLLCDLLLFLVFIHTSPSLVHALWFPFMMFVVAAMVPLLLGTLLLWRSTHPRFPNARNTRHNTQQGMNISKEEDSMHPTLMHRPGKVEWLERLLLLFFLLTTLSLVVLYVVTPSLYVTKLFFSPSPTDPYPLPVTLLLGSILVFIAVVVVGVMQHWRWVFWLLLVAFGCSVLEFPVILLQFVGLLPGQPPIWYGLSQMGVALLEVVCAVWMFHIYRYHGVWAMGKNIYLLPHGVPWSSNERDNYAREPEQREKEKH